MNAKRQIDAVLLLDKPTGFSSNAVLQRVKRLFNATKAGHTGSLDPLATGMLPILFGQASRLSQYLLDADKEYCVRGKLGVTTATGDVDGEIITTCDNFTVSAEDLAQQLAHFRGNIAQVPPMYSALKVQGRPLYKLARAGQTIERAPRQVVIYENALLSFDGIYFELKLRVSKGTYVRSIVMDLGSALGVGATVVELRRHSCGNMHYPMVSLDDLQRQASDERFENIDKHLLSMSVILTDWTACHVSDEQARLLSLGQACQIEGATQQGLVKMLTTREELIGIGQLSSEGILSPNKIFKIPHS